MFWHPSLPRFDHTSVDRSGNWRRAAKGIHHSGTEFFAPNNLYLRQTLTSNWGGAKMPDEEWIKTLADGRKVKFIYQELPVDGAFLTAQLAGNEVVYSVVLTKARNPLSHEDVESHFKGELSQQ
jgi:hypothetical protein